MLLNYEEVKKILNHRFPFLMIDKVIELEKGKKIVAIKNVSGNEIQFLGHFPEYSIMPGVLLIEAMAQAGAILLIVSNDIDTANENIRYYLVGINKARFLSPVVPGDRVEIEITPIKLIKTAGIVEALIRVDGKTAATAEITFGAKP